MRDTNFKKTSDEKKIHYDSVRNFFRKNAYDKVGFYDSKSMEDVELQLKKRRMWKIYTSVLDEILLKDLETLSVIDVACGMGNFTLELIKRDRFTKIVGIDFLKETFNIASRAENIFGNVSFLQGNLLNLPFKNESFDLTVYLNTLHHIHKSDYSKVINELARITNKYLMIEIRNKNYIFETFINRIIVPKFYREMPLSCISISEIENIMNKNCFQQIIIRGKSSINFACRRLLFVYKRI